VSECSARVKRIYTLDRHIYIGILILLLYIYILPYRLFYNFIQRECNISYNDNNNNYDRPVDRYKLCARLNPTNKNNLLQSTGRKS